MSRDTIGPEVAGALRHRGPDAHAHLRSDHWELFHTRLSINDLSALGNQPMPNEDETLWLSFNGEIYNSPELRAYCEAKGHRFRSHSDAEVVLHLWEMEGERCLERLNGIYAFALASSVTGELHLCRDPLGVKPLFYVANGDGLWFASELRALQTLGAPMGGADTIGLAQFLTFLWIPDPRTPFANAKSVEPGHRLTWTRDGRTADGFAVDILDQRDDDVTDSTANAEIGGRVDDAVTRQLLSDVPIAIMASGGIDSSLVWHASVDTAARAYTIDWRDERGSEGLRDDVSAVETLHGLWGTPISRVDGSDAGIADPPASGDLFADPAYELCRRIARAAHDDGFKVLLSGQGGDELFGGYRRHTIGPVAARLRVGPVGTLVAAGLARLPASRLSLEYVARTARAAAERDALASYLQLCSYSRGADRAQILGCSERDVSDEVVWSRHRARFDAMPGSWSYLRRFRALDLTVYMPGLGLAYNDRAAMEHSVETRVPLLDLELVRWALRLPDESLVRGRARKRVLAALARRILPASVVDRPKRGFGVPQRQLPDPTTTRRGFRQDRYVQLAEHMLQRHGELAT